jgi:PAT family beta-lactamase induction signal transducer AmpG
MQDTVIDAWRIETAQSSDELGVLTSNYQLGYRICESITLAQAIGTPILG